MLLNVHDKDLKIIGILDNESQDAIGYSEDKWTRNLETGSSVYEFTAYNRKLSYETVYTNPFNCLNIGNYVSFTYDGEDHVFKIMSVEKTGRETYCYCENLNLELRNEMVAAYDSGEDELTLEKHIAKMQLLDYTNMVIGLNELSNVKKSVSFSDEETKFSRLLALFQAFGAEHKFTTKLYSNGKVKEFKVDIYKKKDSDGNGGVGRFVKDKILRKGENIKSLKEKQDILEIFNMTVPKGIRKVTRVTQVIPLEKEKKPTVNSNEIIVRSNMINANGTLSIENIQTILKLCYEYRLLPSGVISQLYLESFWGNSNVARVDNNWSGMTWTGNPNRPSGVVVSQGSARPSSEGGHYMHFASMADFFKDYFYLLAKQGIYNVANKTNISDYTRGLFRIGGAAYDYAAAGYDHYNSLMTGIRNGINAKNENVLDTYDNDWKNPKVVTSTTVEQPGAPNTKKALNELSSLVGKTVGNGQCYAVAAWFSYKLNGAGLGCGLGNFSGLVGSGIRACDIGTDYSWGNFGWGVEGSGFSGSNIVAGTILNIKSNYGAPWYTGYYGHTVVVESVNGDTVTVLQQNYAGKQYVTKDNYSLSAIIPSIQTLVQPPELAKGGRVDGGNAVVKVDSVDKYVNVDLPTDVETKEETEEFYIPHSYNNKWYDENDNLEFYISNSAICAPQSAENFPVAFSSKDNGDKWIRRDFEYEVDTVDELIEKSLEDLKKNCYPTLDYEIDGFFNASIGDTYLIEDDDFEPKLTIKARVISQEISHTQPENNKTELSNYVKLKSAVPDALTSRLQQLIDASIPYEIRVTASNGTSFKNNEGESKITVELLKSGIIQEAEFFFKNGNSIVGKGKTLLVKATDFEHVFNLTIEAYVNNELVSTKPITFTDVEDGAQGPQGPQGPQGDEGPQGPQGDKGDTGNGIANTVVTYGLSMSDTTEPATWSSNKPALIKGMYLWTRTVFIYTNGKSTTSYQISYIPNDADATAEIDKTKQELLEKLETVRDDSLASAEEAKQQITAVANDLSTAKQDLQEQASQLTEQANAQSELTKRVSSVEETANGTKTTVSELSKTVDSNTKNITSVTARTKVVEDDLTSTKTTLSQVKTTADGASSKAATLETGLNGVKADLAATTVTANTTKTNLANYQASNDRAVANLQSNMQTANGNISNLQTKVEAVPGQITSAVSAVEGKIPTDIGTVNLIKGTGSAFVMGGGITNTTWNETKKQSILDFSDPNVDRAKGGEILPQNGKFFDFKPIKGMTYTQSIMIDTDATFEPSGEMQFSWFTSKGHNNQKAYIKKIGDHSYQIWSTYTWNLEDTALRAYDLFGLHNVLLFRTTGTYLAFYKPKLTTGNLPSDWEAAPEDTIDQISSLSSQIKQTADGMTLLATKTELNNAKTELQSGISTATSKADNAQATANNNAQTISTHTTQISALNTGLSAKVSQSDFNTLSGRVTTAENNITAKANELSSKITSVEGKIPTSIDTVNLVKGTGSAFVMGGGITNTTWNETKKQAILDFSTPGVNLARSSEILPQGNAFPNFKPIKGMTYTQSIMIDTDATFAPNGQATCSWFTSKGHNEQKAYIKKVGEHSYQVWSTCTWQLEDIALRVFDWFGLHNVLLFRTSGTYLAFYKPKLTTGNLPSDWSPAPEDAIEEISTLSSELKQTADGITLLATKTELSTAKNELQSGINTATNKANNAQATANNNAQTISTHTTQISALNTGLNAKVSQSDFNTLSGRVTTAENNITAKANELSSKITSVESKIPTSVGGTNYLTNISSNWQNKYVVISGASEGSFLQQSSSTRISPKNFIAVEAGKEYTISLKELSDVDYYFKVTMSTVAAYGVANSMLNKDEWIYSDSYTFTAPENCKFVMISVGCDAGVTPDDLNVKFNIKLERGNIVTDWSPAPEDYDSKLSTVQSEFKQTTDSIKASVQSLDNNTVKNSSLTINADGIVMKAGKSTTDVANAIGSYFAVNQNAINLFSDKINVKGHMIVSGSISSDKISSSGITANVIKGGTLQSTNGSTNFELNTGKLFYNNNNTGVFRVQDGASTMGLKFSNTSVTVNGTSRILSRAILGGDRRETTLDDGKWDKGGFSGIIIETIKDVESNVNEKADTLNVIADHIYFSHTYSDDSLSARGWKMETYSPTTSYPGNVVLKPFGINYRSSDIIVGDLRLDNGDGSGYWMRATINVLKACFGHILNGGTSSQALNAIRSELNKISGI